MSKVIENYILSDVIGSGQYGKVYKARNMKNDMVVAIKVVKLEKFREVPKLHEFTINEIQTLSKMENANIVKFIEMLKTQNNMYLIYDFCNGDTLEALIQKRKFLSEPETMQIFAQILNAFKSLAKENILHRDLKPSNILFHDNVVKVADFGFCKSLLNTNDLTQTMVGSPIYMAPEVLKGCSYNSKADVWSLGVVLFECLYGFCPYEDKSIARLIMQIDNKELQFPKHINQISRKCEELVRTMLHIDPKKRVDWAQLMQITFYEDPQITKQISSVPQMVKKLSSSNLTHQSSQQQQQHSYTNVLQDRTNLPTSQQQQIHSQQDDKWQQNNLRILIRERNKVIFITQLVSLLLEQSTTQQYAPQGLSFSQKTIILTYLLFRSACTQCEQVKKLLESDSKQGKLDRIDEFHSTNEYKTFQQTFQREHDSLILNLDSYRSEIQKTIRYMQAGDITQQLRSDLVSSQSKQVDQRLLTQILILYAEEQVERIKQFPEEIQLKWLHNLSDLIECSQINEFFDKNLNDVNLRLNEQRYYDQMRKMSKESLEDVLSQRLVSARIRLSK